MLNSLRAEFQVNIDGNDLPVVLNLNAFRILSQKFKVSLADLENWLSSQPLDALPGIAYCGALNHALRNGGEVKMSYEVFAAQFFDHEPNTQAVVDGLEAAFGTPEEDEAGKK